MDVNLVVFLAWNSDNILLGRFWGADALGLYGRTYQLATLPVHQLNEAITGVAFPALSRIQDDADDFSKTLDGVYGRRMILLSPEARQLAALGFAILPTDRRSGRYRLSAAF
jgi:hypothetical protein